MTEPLFVQVEVTAVEDLHTGAGTGSGDIDALVLRDRHGEPVIRASHLKGLLREAGDELIGLGQMDQSHLDDLLGHDVFDRKPSGGGVPRRGALRMTSLRVPKDQRASVLVWGSSAREINSRRPRGDTLRYFEHVAAGTKFEAELRLGNPALRPLLQRLLRRIDRIGGDRNRGAGLVRVSWQPPQKTPKTTKKPEKVPPSGAPEVSRLRAGFIPRDLDSATAEAIAPEHKKLTAVLGTTLRLVLRNREPLCLPATGHPGSLIRSHSFIRGQALRGALMAWAIGRGKMLDVETVYVGDALPLPKGLDVAATVMPIPLSILSEKPKGEKSSLPWWAGRSDQKMSDRLGAARDEQKEKPKRPGAHEYLCRRERDSVWVRYVPEMNVRLRNQTPARGSGKDANLFSLEEIAEDTLFQADLVFEPGTADKFIDVFEPLLTGEDWLAIGRGGQPVQVEAAHWSMGEPEIEFKDDWSLTLTSDLVLRDQNLGFFDNLDLKTLCTLANNGRKSSNPASAVAIGNDWKIADKFVETEAIHGFNAVSGMHRSPALAIRRGSCWKITGAGSAALAKALWQKQFLGERTKEGCGRFAIGLQPIERLEKPDHSSASPQVRHQELLLSQAKHLKEQCKKDEGPSLSQLQWLRERALATRDKDDLKKLLRNIERARQDRPQGGSAWKIFPVAQLIEEVDRLTDFQEKQHLISHLVQWLAPDAKNRRKKR